MRYPKFVRIFNNRMATVSGFIILMIGLFSVIEVIMRGVFGSPTIWTADVNQYLLIWAVFLSAGYGFQSGGHVKVDVLTNALKTPVRRILAAIANLVCLAFVWILTQNTWAMFIKAYQSKTVTYAILVVPRWALILAMLIGCVTMIVTLISILLSILGNDKKYI